MVAVDYNDALPHLERMMGEFPTKDGYITRIKTAMGNGSVFVWDEGCLGPVPDGVQVIHRR